MLAVPLIELHAETFSHAIARGTTLVWWWAPSCSPSRAFHRICGAAAARHPHIVFASVDTDHEPALAAAMHIRALPTLMVFLDHTAVFSHAGFHVAETLDALIHAVGRLEVRRRTHGSRLHRSYDA